jgi:hypothetical protein
MKKCRICSRALPEESYYLRFKHRINSLRRTECKDCHIQAVLKRLDDSRLRMAQDVTLKPQGRPGKNTRYHPLVKAIREGKVPNGWSSGVANGSNSHRNIPRIDQNPK